MLGVPIRVHDMTGDDVGIAHVPTPIETGDVILLERGEYRVLDVISLENDRSLLHALVRLNRHVCDTPADAPSSTQEQEAFAMNVGSPR